jgi:iron(II)-dependent oxidoreductase
MGLSQHEATAFANWAASLGGNLAGAVVQHEYQWEVAARSGLIEQVGRVWEWCANPFHPYPQFCPYPSDDVSETFFDQRHFSLRGASLHTQPSVRRPSFRNWAPAEDRFRFTGTRLVFPPG